jgi:hypothetical protein
MTSYLSSIRQRMAEVVCERYGKASEDILLRHLHHLLFYPIINWVFFCTKKSPMPVKSEPKCFKSPLAFMVQTWV